MAFQGFLKITPNPNSRYTFTDQITVESFSFGATSTGEPGGGPGAGAGAGRSTFSDLTVTKLLDVNSPSLYAVLATGQSLPAVQLTLDLPGQGEESGGSATYTLTNVLVTAIHDSGNASDGFPPEEVVGFDFAKIEIKVDGNDFRFDTNTNRTFS
ncbi:MAG: type VI secretion system tube protein Hcp [Armatimonadetes bacterium]|nr:type VI secretion system tube protein Hcp [Armatimonadota bacterium]